MGHALSSSFDVSFSFLSHSNFLFRFYFWGRRGYTYFLTCQVTSIVPGILDEEVVNDIGIPEGAVKMKKVKRVMVRA